MHSSKNDARRMVKRTARPAAWLALIAVSLTGAMAFAAESRSVKLQIYRPTDDVQAAQVYRVIQNAARQVCQPLESRELGRLRYYMRCMNEAVTTAVAELHSDPLTAYYLGQHGGKAPRT
jgi:UrcA family protein